MTELEKAARMALEALESMKTYAESTEPGLIVGVPAIDALRRALEQPTSGIKQVIELYDSPEQPAQQHQDWCASLTQMLMSMPPKPAPCNCKPKQPAQQEPVAIDRSDAVNLARNMLEVRNCKGITSYGVRVLCEAVMKMDAALYTRPQAREPLSDEQIKDVAAFCRWWVREKDILDDAIEFARAIEAAHGIGEKK